MDFNTEANDQVSQPFEQGDYYKEPSLSEVASAAWNTTRATELFNSKDISYSNVYRDKLKPIMDQDKDDSYSYESFVDADVDLRQDYMEQVDNGKFYLDENDKVVSEGFANSLKLDIGDDYNIVKGYLLSKKNGLDFSNINEEVLETTREQVKKDKATLENSTGFVSGAVEFGASVAANFTDPVNVALLPFGMGTAVGKGLIGNVMAAGAREAGLGALAETITQPFAYDWKQELGLDYDIEDAVMNIAAATVGGFVLGGAGSFIADVNVIRKAIDEDTTLAQGKEIFERWDRLQNLSLTKDTTKNLDIMRKANQDMARGNDVEVSQALKDQGDIQVADGLTIKDHYDNAQVASGEKAMMDETELVYREGVDDSFSDANMDKVILEAETFRNDFDADTSLEYNTIKREMEIIEELDKCRRA